MDIGRIDVTIPSCNKQDYWTKNEGMSFLDDISVTIDNLSVKDSTANVRRKLDFNKPLPPAYSVTRLNILHDITNRYANRHEVSRKPRYEKHISVNGKRVILNLSKLRTKTLERGLSKGRSTKESSTSNQNTKRTITIKIPNNESYTINLYRKGRSNCKIEYPQ